MQIFFSFIIAVLLTVFTDGLSFAQMMGERCHEQEQVIVEDTKKCVCCSLGAMHVRGPESWDDAIAGAGCCPQQTCGSSIIFKDIAPTVFVSPVFSTGKILSSFLIQPVPLWTLGVHSSGLPPPRWPSAPAYIQNCSFLI
jgi:hypothetical protein